MTDFKAGDQYIYAHRRGSGKRNGETVTIIEDQHMLIGFVGGVFKDGTVGAFYPDELTKKEEDSVTEINVGDTVRITKDYPFGTGGGKDNRPGVEFTVTKVVKAKSDQGLGGFWVNGDPLGRGIWAQWIEKVEPDSRWRYNDHIVVYPKAEGAVPGRAVDVLDENEPKVYQRWENSIAHPEGEITDAARAYWNAHEHNPVIKEAKIRGDYAYFAYQLRYNDTSNWLRKYSKADIDAALPVIDRLALNASGE